METPDFIIGATFSSTSAALLKVSLEGFLAALAFVALETLSASPAL